MKRFCTALLALALVLSLAPMAFALTPSGTIYLYEDGGYTSVSGTLTPGKTYYIELGQYNSADSKPTKANAKLTCERVDGDKKVSLTSSSLNIEKKKLHGGSTYYYCVELKLKDIPLSSMSVDEHAFDLSGTISPNKLYDDFSIARTVAYDTAGSGDEIESTPQLFMFDDEDVSIDLPGNYGRIEFTTKNQVKTLLAMDTNYNDTIANKYPNANIDFLNGNGASIGKTATMYIESDAKYLYELKNGKLTDLTSKYDQSEDAFVIKTSTLDTYLLSSAKLSGSALPPANSTPSDSTPPAGSGSGSGSGSTGASGSTLASVIKNNFSNEFRVINYGDSYKAIANVQLKVAGLDISNLNKNTLIVYAYDQANNRLIPLNAKAKIGNDGALYFNTTAQGYYVITDSALKVK